MTTKDGIERAVRTALVTLSRLTQFADKPEQYIFEGLDCSAQVIWDKHGGQHTIVAGGESEAMRTAALDCIKEEAAAIRNALKVLPTSEWEWIAWSFAGPNLSLFRHTVKPHWHVLLGPQNERDAFADSHQSYERTDPLPEYLQEKPPVPEGCIEACECVYRHGLHTIYERADDER